MKNPRIMQSLSDSLPAPWMGIIGMNLCEGQEFFLAFEAFKTEVASIFPRNQATHTQPWLWQMYNLFVERK